MTYKTAVVTGSTKGIGFSLASKLLDTGYKVFMSYSNDLSHAMELKEKLSAKYNDNCFIIDKVDLSDINESIEYINKLKLEASNIDVLVFNATATDRSPFEELQLESWEKIMRINVTIPFLFVQSLIPNLKNSLDKCIVFTGSIMGIYPHPLSIAYGVSKSAEHALSKNLVKFLEPYGIRTNVIAPGFVETEMQRSKPEYIRNNIYDKLSLHRFATVEEIIDAFMFIINNQYINGSILEIDGGYSYQ